MGSSDVGRRVAERRNELHLSVDSVAQRAGVSPAYLESVESRDSPVLRQETLVRLAHALDTSVTSLAGGGIESPQGQQGPSQGGVLGELSREECYRLLSAGGVGRIVLSTDRGPVAIPVNYQVAGSDIVFRIEGHSSVARYLPSDPASFEVDRIDDPLFEGWSVLLTGRAHVVDHRSDETGVPEVVPWAGGRRDTYVRLEPHTVTGRRIRHDRGG
jgi:transcriptional regulator with XRE-family HTH domain